MIEFFNCIFYFICCFHSFSTLGIHGSKRPEKYKGIYSQEIVNYEVVVPKRVDEHGKFISNLIPHRYSKRSTDESNAIFYTLPIAGEDRLIQLTPNLMLISPGAVIEVHGKNDPKRSKASNGKFENLRIRRLRETECHYNGIVKGMEFSKVALSTCFGLAGFIQISNGTFNIEPVTEYDLSGGDEHPHILYRNDDDNKYNWTICNTPDYHRNRTIRDVKSVLNSENASTVLYPVYIETLIVMDKNVWNYHQYSDSENYILTVFNMAFNIFNDASLGFVIKLSVVRIIRLETQEEEMNMNANQDAIKTLKYFQDWQYRINPGDDTHPNHHDVAILITRFDLYTNTTYGFLGVSTLGSACDKKLSAVLCRDNGLRLGFVMAHQIAHLLGVEHDGFNNSCATIDGDGFRTVMHPQVLLTTETWSRCSQRYIKVFLDSGLGSCLFDEPREHNFKVHDLLPGAIYNADHQCKLLVTPRARECDMGSTCDSLNCQVPGYICMITKTPPAAGTPCGENMWCHQQRCLMIGERPDATDGSWSDWSPWSECTRTCGSGVSRSERYCNRPVPSHGGRYCSGESTRHRICSLKPCDVNQPSFRDLQCNEFNDWTFPEDGLKHVWKEYFYHEGNPCILFCINENNDVVALKPRVIDGTNCHKGNRDVCVEGVCKPIPCDLNLESNAIEDICGICHGDGTTCDFTQGQQSMAKFPKAMTKLISIPAGSRNVKVEEVTPSAARILVRDKESKDFYIRGNKLGVFHVPGSQAWLGMTKWKQESLAIPGPVSRALTIWIERVEDVTVKWSVALPVTQQRKPEFAWDFIQWSTCSAACGLGTQTSEPSCIEEKAGLVESIYCADLVPPPPKIRLCENVKCKPRWMVGDWKDCENASTSGRVKRRTVHCVKTVGEGEGFNDILPDQECPSPKPKEEQPCDTRHKRDSPNEEAKALGETNCYEESASLSSSRIKFGSHKKYDEYLKNFVAISSPQRNSETIPVQIVNTPHFKHYYRVLQASENVTMEPKTDMNFDNMPNLKEDSKTNANSFLSQIYKKTFSGTLMNFNYQESNQKNMDDIKISSTRLHSPSHRTKKVTHFASRKSNDRYLWDNSMLSNLKTRKYDTFNPRKWQTPKATYSEVHIKRLGLDTIFGHPFSFPSRQQETYMGKSGSIIPRNRHGAHHRLLHRKRSILPAAKDQFSLNDQQNTEKMWRKIKSITGYKTPNLKYWKSKPKDQNSKISQKSIVESNAARKSQWQEKAENLFSYRGSMENYTIRFGEVLIDKDEEENLEIFLENSEKREPSSSSPIPETKVWNVSGDEALNLMKIVTELESENITASRGNEEPIEYSYIPDLNETTLD